MPLPSTTDTTGAPIGVTDDPRGSATDWPSSPPSAPPTRPDAWGIDPGTGAPAGWGQATPPFGVPPLPPQPPVPSGARRPGSGWGGVVAAFVLTALVVAVVILGINAGAGLLRSSTTTADAPRRPVVPTTPAAPGGPTTTDPAPSSPSAPTGWSEVAAKVNVGVVNIESRMFGGVGAGTGMVIDAGGVVLTNNHVVEGADTIEVTLVTTGDTYDATIIGTDPDEDVAVLQLDGAEGLEVIPLGDSDAVAVGDAVAAIGNAGGRGGQPKVAPGEVIGLDKTIRAADPSGGGLETLRNMIQVDADVRPGDSGGPLASDAGEVVGMTTAAASGIGASTSPEGYAIPINRALELADSLRSSGSGGTGRETSPTTEDQGEDPSGIPGGEDPGTPATGGARLGVQVYSGPGGGALVVGVVPGSPADEAGLQTGDLIVEIDGTVVRTSDDVVDAIGGHEPGDTITIVWDSVTGQTGRASVTLVAA